MKLKRIVAFILAIALVVTALPGEMISRAEGSGNVETIITLDPSKTDDAKKIHRSYNESKPGDSGVKEYTAQDGFAINNANMTYDHNNRNVKVCIYNLRKLMTEKIGTSNDKGIGRYPYVVTKLNVKESGYYDIGTEINMRADAKVNTMAIVVDGVVHVKKATIGSTAHQEVWKNNIYLSAGEHSILYMSAIPQNESDCPTTADKYYYPWTNFWSFMVKKTSGEAINNSVEYLDVSGLAGTDVENIFKESTRIEAEDTKYVTWNIYSKTENNASASGSTVVGGVPSYGTSQQTFDDLTNNGLDKTKTPYLQYMVEAPAAGEYYLTIGAYIGTSSNANKTNANNPVPYIAVLVNDNTPIQAQFDGKWNGFDSVTVPVQLKAGINIIRCTSVVKGQYAEGSSAWVNFDYFEVQKGLTVKPVVVSATDSDYNNYLKLNFYDYNSTDKLFAINSSGRGNLKWDYPSLYEEMLGIYSPITVSEDRTNLWPYIAFNVYAEQAGEYQISAGIGKSSDAKFLGMIVDGAMHVIDITSTSTELTKSVYLTKGKHLVIFTSPMPKDSQNSTAYNEYSTNSSSPNHKTYAWHNYLNFEVSEGLCFDSVPTDADIQTAMTNYLRIESEDVSYASYNGNYNEATSVTHTTRYNTGNTTIIGAEGLSIDGSVSETEKKVNTTQTYEDIKAGNLNKELTSYIQHIVIAEQAGKYMIRVGAYVEGSGTMPYGTILVNGNVYKAQFTGGWNGYEAVNLPVDLNAGENIIQCIGVTADQTETNGWIGYDFIDVPRGIVTEHKEVSAADDDWSNYLYLNRYQDKGTNFGGPNYSDMRYDFPSLYEEMLGIYSDLKPDRADYWPYIAFTVHAEQAGNYQISTKIETTDSAKTIGMIVDGVMHVVDVTTTKGYLTESVYLTEGTHVIVFTSPIPSDIASRPQKQDNAYYPWLNFISFKLSAGLNFVGVTEGIADDIKAAMTNYTRIEAEDIIYASANGNYNTAISKNYKRRYGTSTVNDAVKIQGFEGAKIDGSVSDSEKKVNTTQTYADIAAGSLDKELTSYVQYVVKAETAGTYVLRIGAYVEGSGTKPFGTILVNGKAYKAEFTGNWNGYDAVNLPVELKAGENTIQCIGVTADQTGTNGWIGYDFIDIPRELEYHEPGEYTDTSVEKGLTFERRTTYETDGTISETPYTISTWVYLPSGYSPVGGVIFGNYLDGETPCANFEIDANGVPTFYHINGEGKKVSLAFDMVDVCADEWTNLTFTISGNDVSCYRNGAFVATLTSDVDIDMEAVKNQYLLGGDLRPTTEEGSPNARYFKGRIIDVALYDKALSKEEVLKVYKGEAIATTPYTRYELENAEKDKDVPDTMGDNDLEAKISYFTDKEPVTDYAYSFAVVGDTQIVVENDVNNGENNLSKIYDWILNNKDSKNIQYVFGLGDITENNNKAEWAHAKSQISRLDGEIPYSVIRGNHDLVGSGTAEDKTADYMTEYLGTHAYKNQFAEEGGFYDANISNSWRTFTVGEVKYLMLALDYAPNDDVLEWAGKIIKNHPDHSVIITTHAYLYRDGTPMGILPSTNEESNEGDDMWEKLVSKHENIVLVMCGHDPSDNIVVSRDKGVNGNIVTSMLIDPQGVDSDTGSTGMLAMLYFSEDGRKVQVEYFSTVKGAYFKEVNQFSLDLFGEEVSASHEDWDEYLKLNMYLDNGTSFGVGNGSDGKTNYGHIRYDYPSLYEDMLGIYSDVKPDRANWWPYIAFTVNAEEAGEYQISANIGTNNKADAIGMIVDGAMHVVDVTTKMGDLTESVYLTEGEHVIIFTSPMPRDMESRPSTTGSNADYPYMDFKTFKLSAGLSFGEKPTDADIQNAMSEYTRIEADDISYTTTNGNYNADVSKTYSSRYGNGIVKIKGFKGAKIDGSVSDSEKKVNTTQTFKEIENGLDAKKTSYVQYKVITDKAGSYTIRVGAYVEGSGTMPYGTILVNGKAYKAQFSGDWNGYDAANLTVELKAGENTIQCIGVTADQKDTNGWIGYDFIDIPGGVGTEHKEVSASDKDWNKYLTLNKYEDQGGKFSDPKNYADLRYDYPSLYEDMLGIYSEVKPDRAGYWPYVAFTVNAEKAGEYQISAKIGTSEYADTVAMIVDGAVHIVKVSETSELLKKVYLSKGEHVIIFTSPMPRDMVSAPTTTGSNKEYPWMDYYTFKLGIGLSFGKAPTDKDIQKSMTSYTRLEAEDIVYATYNANYGTDVTKKYAARYNNAMTTIMGASGAAIDGKVTAEEMKANTSQTYAQLSQGLDVKATSYVQYSINAKQAGAYMIRVGAYIEGSGTMPYGTILVNGTAYKVQFTGNWNGYDVVNLLVELREGKNTIQCIGVTADQTDSNGWIGYDYLDIQSGLSANGTGATVINAGDEKLVTFNDYKDKGDTLGEGSYGDLRWDRLSLDMLNYAYLGRMPYAAIRVKAAVDGTYDVYFTSQYDTTATSKQFGVLVDGVTTYTMTVSEFRSHVAIPLTAGTHTLVFTSPMPVDMEAAAKTAKMDKKAYPWMDMEMIILGKGLTVEKAPNKNQLEKPFETIEVEEYAITNLARITENGSGSAQYLKAQTAAEIVKSGIDPTVTPFVEYHIDASAAGEYTIYVALTSGMVDAMTAEKQLCNIVIENGDARQVQKLYSHKDTQGVARVIPVTLNLEKGINEVRITHFTGDSIQGKGYVWNDFDYIEMSPETAKKITFLPTSVLEAEEASFVSYSDKLEEGMSGGGYLGSADYGYIDENKITFEALDVENLDDVPRVTYTFEAEKAGTYTLSVKFRTGLINYEPEELEKIGFAVIVNGKDKQLVEYEMAALTASITRTITVELVEGENEITFTSTLADFMNAVSPRIESDYRLVYVDHDALYLSYGLSTGKEAEKFSVEDSSVERSQLDLLGVSGDEDNVSGITAQQVAGIVLSALVLAIFIILILVIIKRKKQEKGYE